MILPNLFLFSFFQFPFFYHDVIAIKIVCMSFLIFFSSCIAIPVFLDAFFSFFFLRSKMTLFIGIPWSPRKDQKPLTPFEAVNLARKNFLCSLSNVAHQPIKRQGIHVTKRTLRPSKQEHGDRCLQMKMVSTKAGAFHFGPHI